MADLHQTVHNLPNPMKTSSETAMFATASSTPSRPLSGVCLGTLITVKRRRALLTFFLAAISLGHAATLPDLITYGFTVAETKTLPGTSAASGPPNYGTIAATDQIRNLALVSLFYQNGCYTGGRHNHNDYPMAFVLNVGKGRVFHSPLGHDVKAFNPAVLELFRRGTAWAAGKPPVP